MGGVGPIPWTAIDLYAQRLGIGDDEIAYGDFVALIQALDDRFLEQKAQQLRSEREKASGSSRRVHQKAIRARPKR